MSWGATFCLITGASRGIGQAIAVKISKKLGEGSVLLLLARTQAGLDETKKLVEKVNDRVQVHPVTMDLQKAGTQEYKRVIEDCLKNINKNASEFKKVVLVHNVAGVWRESALKLENGSNLQDDFFINFISPVLLTTQFFKMFNDNTISRNVIQITSAAGQGPCPMLSMYGSVKSARDHFFRTLAVEEPTIQVLNYDPGTVETDMLHRAATESGQTFDEFKSFVENFGYPVLMPSESAKVLVGYLEQGFTSGSLLNAYKSPKMYAEIQKKGAEMMEAARIAEQK